MWRNVLDQKKKDEKIDIEIVCVYNDEIKLQKELLATLMRQETLYNVRFNGINNSQGQYSSMAEAYNSILKLLEGEWTIFLHQDILFNANDSLDEILGELKKMNSNSIVGWAGAIRYSRQTITTKTNPIEVETVDESFFCVTTKRVKELKFNKHLCDNWHMYAVEMCLHNKCLGEKNYVIKANITHLSPGIISSGYIETLYKLLVHYKKLDVDAIWTTCAKVNLKKPYYVYIWIWRLKHEVLNKIIRPLMNAKL